MRLARKSIDKDALVHNYHYMKSHCLQGGVLVVVKSDAYGHGLVKTAKTLSVDADADGFAVAVLAEGVALREAGIRKLVLLMQGVSSQDELSVAAAQNLTLVVHSFEQLVQLERRGAEGLALWVKFDTGMNRLGFPVEAVEEVLARVQRLRGLSQEPVIMSHFAYADELDLVEEDRAQWELFEKIHMQSGLPASIANSAGALCRPQSQLRWVRSGIALYGAVPVTAAVEHGRQLRPVMRVTAPLTAIRQCKAGDRIGYGGDYVCQRDMKVGVVGIGYGDGYPRHARNGTPVWLGGKRCELVGRVSMDMITIALNDETAMVDDDVELWGAQLPVAEVAAYCDTISYELLCAARGIEEETA